MLFDTRNEQTDVTINVDNTQQKAKASGLQKAMFYGMMIIATIPTFGAIWIIPIKIKNRFNEMQVKVQEASSGIQAAQAKRRAALTKVMDAVKGYKNHESDVLKTVTQYRAKIDSINKNTDIQTTQNILDSVSAGLQLTFEQYPDLKADRMYMQFSNEAILQEDEIYAARRLYNKHVTEFNQKLYTFPKIVIADRMQLYNLPFFTATELERADVDTSSII
ncbi:LemA family protein [[Mycoplasma] gypis]|uniref:LemA family protein n=1 Tax=[Mycoplasma] gypis TaxID=92404 RepID=A0ABZ2RQ21_9BACT|nr:LemA family protein [[Mycoplasma] gypis]MBN0919643.1 LemA family protein [[Mycoplasma] gypis]